MIFARTGRRALLKTKRGAFFSAGKNAFLSFCPSFARIGRGFFNGGQGKIKIAVSESAFIDKRMAFII